MAKDNMKKILTALPGVLLIALVAGVLTYGGQKAVAEATKPKATVVKTVTVTPKDETSNATTPGTSTNTNSTTKTTTTDTTAASSTAASNTTTPVAKTATTNSFVYLRPTAATSGTALAGLDEGTKVEYETKTTGQWQAVTVNGKSGYVFVRYLDY